jgi:hypothetical protein
MPFWSENFTAGGLKDPKRKFRFKVTFTGFGDQSFLWWAKSAGKPSFTIGEADHKFLNHTFFYPGTVTWNPVSVVLVDPIDPDMAASFTSMIEGGGYHPPVNSTDLSTMTKSTAASALGKVYISQLNAKGEPLETWELYNAWIKDVKYGELAYGEDALTEISVELKYDWAKLAVTTAGSTSTIGDLPAGTKKFF